MVLSIVMLLLYQLIGKRILYNNILQKPSCLEEKQAHSKSRSLATDITMDKANTPLDPSKKVAKNELCFRTEPDGDKAWRLICLFLGMPVQIATSPDTLMANFRETADGNYRKKSNNLKW